MTAHESRHLHKMLKKPEIQENYDGEQIKALTEKCWRTLDDVMQQIYLKNECKLIGEGYTKRIEAEKK